ncbi:MAG: methyl-accepting chemotaxis protein [Synergistaceae bacterium]|jgi:methyl-accepting chemotaxis protein|nr:methyl-accepting chemotaxis protein [Synergistaceae bacterium]
MWRNLRLGLKLSFSFGALLLVFLLGVAVSYRGLRGITAENSYMVNAIVPVGKVNSRIERTIYNLALATERLHTAENAQYSDDKDTATAVVARSLEEIAKESGEIAALGAAYPTLHTPKMFRDELLPPYERYAASIAKTMSLLDAIAAVFKVQSESGRVLSEAASKFSELLFQELKNASGTTVSSRAEAYRLAVGVEAAIQNVRLSMFRAALTNDAQSMSAVQNATSGVSKNLAALKSYVSTPEEKTLLDTMTTSFAAYESQTRTQSQNYADKAKEEAVRVPLVQAISEKAAELNGEALKSMDATSQRSMQGIERADAYLFGTAAAALLLGLLLTFIISRGMCRPIAAVVSIAKRAEDGDLTIKRSDFGYYGKDEIGVLCDAVSNMIEAQGDSMRTVVDVAYKMPESAEDLAHIADGMTAAMVEVKGLMDHITSLGASNSTALQASNAGIEEMSAGADTVAHSATDGAAFVSQTTEASLRAVQTVEHVIKGMHDVDSNAKASRDKLDHLVSSVENVSGFVNVITGIADQTNLLALNAAIEAARAGDVGRGFAVVAEEVRKLAEESARAAQSVNGIIDELQSGAQSSIAATVEAGRMLEDTLTRAEQAQTELDGALKEVNKINDSIQNIAAIAEEQAASSKEIATGIDRAARSSAQIVDELDEIVKAAGETANTAIKITAESETINGHIALLMKALARFKLGHDGERAPALPAKR